MCVSQQSPGPRPSERFYRTVVVPVPAERWCELPLFLWQTCTLLCTGLHRHAHSHFSWLLNCLDVHSCSARGCTDRFLLLSALSVEKRRVECHVWFRPSACCWCLQTPLRTFDWADGECGEEHEERTAEEFNSVVKLHVFQIWRKSSYSYNSLPLSSSSSSPPVIPTTVFYTNSSYITVRYLWLHLNKSTCLLLLLLFYVSLVKGGEDILPDKSLLPGKMSSPLTFLYF